MIVKIVDAPRCCRCTTTTLDCPQQQQRRQLLCKMPHADAQVEAGAAALKFSNLLAIYIYGIYVFAVLIYVRDLIRRNSQGAAAPTSQLHCRFWPYSIFSGAHSGIGDRFVAQTGTTTSASLRLWAKRFWLQSYCFLLLVVAASSTCCCCFNYMLLLLLQLQS